MAFLKKHSHVAAYVLLTFTLFLSLSLVQQQSEDQIKDAATNAARVAYKNLLDSCDRGNRLRAVVYRNTQNAIKQNPGSGFEAQLAVLQETPFLDPATGLVDCEAAVEDPSVPGAK